MFNLKIIKCRMTKLKNKSTNEGMEKKNEA